MSSDVYAIPIGMGTRHELAGLTDSEFCAFVLGILPLAAQSPEPGYLLVAADVPVEAIHVATVAGVRPRVARSALRKLEANGTLIAADELGCLRVRHWRRDHARGRSRTLSTALRREIAGRDGYLCGICGDHIADALHIDHIIPVAYGGSDHPSNLQAAHAACNQRKGARC